tara:strand:- start:202 stop:492 length:291 start_codon:yes stop_codon:yes gene_type:complete
MGFARKLKRKTMVVQRKQFMRDFKKAMSNFKLQVKCSECGRYPNEGENIDDWKINKMSENIDLICTDCYNVEEDQGDQNENREETQGAEDENSTEL